MMRLVAVYQASDELSANTVRDLLRHHEIAAVARCTDLFRTMLLPLPLLLRREWGVVQVQEADAEYAREIIASFFSADAEVLPTDEPEDTSYKPIEQGARHGADSTLFGG